MATRATLIPVSKTAVHPAPTKATGLGGWLDQRADKWTSESVRALEKVHALEAQDLAEIHLEDILHHVQIPVDRIQDVLTAVPMEDSEALIDLPAADLLQVDHGDHGDHGDSMETLYDGDSDDWDADHSDEWGFDLDYADFWGA